MNKEEKKYNQILDKKEMSKEEAEDIIDEMYHDKIKVYGEGNVVHVNLIGTVKYTYLEFASVRLLREVVSLENEIRDLYKMMSSKDDEIEYLADKIEQLKEDYQILKDDIEGHRIANVDTPEFEENYISKDKIRKKIDLIDKEYAEIIEKNKNDLYLVNINAQRHSAMQLILEELLGE